MIIDGKKIGDKILEEVKEEVAKLPFRPLFCDVLVGSDPASLQYVGMKAKTAEEVGIVFHRAEFPETINTSELIEEIKKLNSIQNMCGIIVQLPIPKHLDKQSILDAIDTRLDVDCLGTITSEKFYNGKNNIGYPTALACLAILDSLNIDLSDKKIVVLGQGQLVGKPLTYLLKDRGLQVNGLGNLTKNKEDFLKNADIIISAIGQGKYLKSDMIKEGVIIIDAGTSESTGSIVGDVDLDSVSKIVSYVSPVPGGVGPVTVAMLLKNILTVAQNYAQ